MGAEGGVGEGTSGTGGAGAELERRKLPLGSWKGSWKYELEGRVGVGCGNRELEGDLERAVRGA